MSLHFFPHCMQIIKNMYMNLPGFLKRLKRLFRLHSLRPCLVWPSHLPSCLSGQALQHLLSSSHIGLLAAPQACVPLSSSGLCTFPLPGVLFLLPLTSKFYWSSNLSLDMPHRGKAFQNPKDQIKTTPFMFSQHFPPSIQCVCQGCSFHINWCELWINVCLPECALCSMMAGSVSGSSHHSMPHAEHMAWSVVDTQIFVEPMCVRDKP